MICLDDNQNKLRIEFETKIRDIYILAFPLCGNCGAVGSHVHHIIPLSLGGTNKLSNLVTLCDVCHGVVHGKDFYNWKTLQKKGIERAKKLGKYKGGKKRIDMPNNFEEVYKRWKAGNITSSEAMKETKLKKTTFYAMVKKYEKGASQ